MILNKKDYKGYILLENQFLRKPEDYTQYVNPVEEYMEQAAKYVSVNLNIDIPTASIYVREVLKDSDIKYPSITCNVREDNFDKFKRKTSLIAYINTAKKNKEIIVPSLTTYLNSKKLNSFQKEFIQGNLTKRKAAKRKMANAKADGRQADFIYYNVLQKVLKIFNNSLSGAYAIVSTVLYNPSAHYTLTSLTRAVASIGNAVSEMMISGNRYYKDFRTVINSITSTIVHVDLNRIQHTVNKYNMHIPTITETYDMVLRSSRLYWKSDSKEIKIYDYISKLSDVERCAIVYVNDLYQVRILNDALARDLIGSLAKKEKGYYYNNDYSVLKDSQEFVTNLAHHICEDELRGIRFDYVKYAKTSTMDTVVSTVKNINIVLNKYQDLIKTFFGTDVMPIDIAYIKDMLRRAIVLSDTDSTCATYNDYVTWYFGVEIQSTEGTAISAAVMTINTQVIDHFLKVLSANMGVEIDVRDMLAMKNEFYWPNMTPANVSKHYYAGVAIQEGTVFKTLERELKGVHLHANLLPQYFKNKSMSLIDGIQDDILNNRKLDLHKYVKYVSDLEVEIINTLKGLNPKVLKNGKVNEAKAYTNGAEGSAYRYHTLWNTVFSGKYGTVAEPPYTTYELPVILKNTTGQNTLRKSNVGDDAIRNALADFTKKNFASGLSTIKIPKAKIDSVGIPEELLDVIDIHRSVEIIMNVFYIILETIGFYKKPKMLIHEQLDIE